MGPAVGWVEGGSQTLLWVLNCGAALMGLIRERHTQQYPGTTAAAATVGTGTALEPLRWPWVPLGWDGQDLGSG